MAQEAPKPRHHDQLNDASFRPFLELATPPHSRFESIAKHPSHKFRPGVFVHQQSLSEVALMGAFAGAYLLFVPAVNRMILCAEHLGQLGKKDSHTTSQDESIKN